MFSWTIHPAQFCRPILAQFCPHDKLTVLRSVFSSKLFNNHQDISSKINLDLTRVASVHFGTLFGSNCLEYQETQHKLVCKHQLLRIDCL